MLLYCFGKPCISSLTIRDCAQFYLLPFLRVAIHYLLIFIVIDVNQNDYNQFNSLFFFFCIYSNWVISCHFSFAIHTTSSTFEYAEQSYVCTGTPFWIVCRRPQKRHSYSYYKMRIYHRNVHTNTNNCCDCLFGRAHITTLIHTYRQNFGKTMICEWSRFMFPFGRIFVSCILFYFWALLHGTSILLRFCVCKLYVCIDNCFIPFAVRLFFV